MNKQLVYKGAALVLSGVMLLNSMTSSKAQEEQPPSNPTQQVEQQVEYGPAQDELVWNQPEVSAADAVTDPQWSGSARWNRKTDIVKFLVHTRNFPAEGVDANVRGYIKGVQVYTDTIKLSGTYTLGVEIYKGIHPEVTFPTELALEIDVFGQTTRHVYTTPETAPTFGWMWYHPGVCGQQVAVIQGQGTIDPHNEVFYGPTAQGPWTFIESFDLPADEWTTGVMTVTEEFPQVFWTLQRFYGGASQANPRGEKVDGPFTKTDCSTPTATPTNTAVPPITVEPPTATPTPTNTAVPPTATPTKVVTQEPPTPTTVPALRCPVVSGLPATVPADGADVILTIAAQADFTGSVEILQGDNVIAGPVQYTGAETSIAIHITGDSGTYFVRMTHTDGRVLVCALGAPTDLDPEPEPDVQSIQLYLPLISQ